MGEPKVVAAFIAPNTPGWQGVPINVREDGSWWQHLGQGWRPLIAGAVAASGDLREAGTTPQGWTVWEGCEEVECPTCGFCFSRDAADVEGHEEEHHTCPLCTEITLAELLTDAGAPAGDVVERTRWLIEQLALARAAAAPPAALPAPEAEGVEPPILGWMPWAEISAFRAGDGMARMWPRSPGNTEHWRMVTVTVHPAPAAGEEG